jgi:muskelin
MSEKNPSVKVLNFLQTEVSSVVNHADPEESLIFRNLLGHLLAPPASLSSVTPAIRNPDERKSSDLETRSHASDDVWTNTLDEDQLMAATASAPTSPPTETPPIEPPPQKHILSADALRSIPDPLEISSDAGGENLSGERYQQRMDIFDSLLLFVGDQWKAPNGNLVDMVDWDG